MQLRKQAEKLLVQHGNGAGWTKHCYAVANAAKTVGDAFKSHRKLDLDFLYAAALLHDIGRYATHDPILHGVEGYNLLIKHGQEELAFVCASHVLFGLDAKEAAQAGLPARDFIPRTIEEQLVPLMDFLIEFDQPTTLRRRFASIHKRYAEDSDFLVKLDRAQEKAEIFMGQLEQDLGQSIEALVASSLPPPIDTPSIIIL
jgi:putative nucleotidyltransferase with HDIG domain